MSLLRLCEDDALVGAPITMDSRKVEGDAYMAATRATSLLGCGEHDELAGLRLGQSSSGCTNCSGVLITDRSWGCMKSRLRERKRQRYGPNSGL